MRDAVGAGASVAGVAEAGEGFGVLAETVRRGGVVVLSGAGLSTESGIPDYRGPTGQARRREPMTYQAFTASAAARQRYWARSHLGWQHISRATPNAGHRAVARLQESGLVTGIITQNVDGLHQAAGAADVTELHGSLHRVRCLDCGRRSARHELDNRMRAANPAWPGNAHAHANGGGASTGNAHANGGGASTGNASGNGNSNENSNENKNDNDDRSGNDTRTLKINPDGDVALEDAEIAGFRVVGCAHCGGVLKPDVVFFGENVPPGRAQACYEQVGAASALLVLGSSLTVLSGFRYVRHAAKLGITVLIVNQGATRGDPLAAATVDAPLGETLADLAAALGQGSPRGTRAR